MGSAAAQCRARIVIAAAICGVGLGAGWAVKLALEAPTIQTPVTTADDGVRAQRKILALYRREGRAGGGTVVLSEREVNALVRRHIAEDLPLAQPVVHLLADGRAEIAGRIRVEDLLAEPPLSIVRGWLPSSARQRGVWLRVTVRPSPRAGGRGRLALTPSAAAIGRLWIPAVALGWLLSADARRYLDWRLPPEARDLRIEQGGLVITTAG